MEIILNDSQKAGIKFLENWWYSKHQMAILEGEAGTGKTTIIKDIVNLLYKAVPLFTAPTNEACRQMELVLPKGSLIQTTYATLGYTMDCTTENKVFKKQRESDAIEQVNLIIVDECSMLPEKLVIDLVDLSKAGKKILFLGHRNQLPPVTQGLSSFEDAVSPVFSLDIPCFTLTKVERSSGELLEYLKHLETLIHAKVKLYKKHNWKKSKDDLYDYLNSREGRKSFKEDKAKVIGYTNLEVEGWNKLIRESIHRGKHLPRFLNGDRILIANPSTIIEKIEKLTEKQLERQLNRTNLNGIPSNSRFQVVEVHETELFGIATWKLLTAEKQDLFVYMDEDKFLSLRKKLVIAAYAESDFRKRLKAFNYFHNVMGCFSDIKHSYSFTTHRAQGMTIPEVWVNLNDINRCTNIGLRHKLLYVAASRAKETMWLME